MGSFRAGLVLAHLSPGIALCLHLGVPVLHRYPWKLHWVQLLGIDLGRRSCRSEGVHPRRPGVTSPGPKNRSKYRETPASPSFGARKRRGCGGRELLMKDRMWHRTLGEGAGEVESFLRQTNSASLCYPWLCAGPPPPWGCPWSPGFPGRRFFAWPWLHHRCE